MRKSAANNENLYRRGNVISRFTTTALYVTPVSGDVAEEKREREEGGGTSESRLTSRVTCHRERKDKLRAARGRAEIVRFSYSSGREKERENEREREQTEERYTDRSRFRFLLRPGA